MSVDTVEDNLGRIYRKLGVRSRAELAARRPGDGGSHPRGLTQHPAAGAARPRFQGFPGFLPPAGSLASQVRQGGSR